MPTGTPPRRAELGLDARPPNATCLAPARPPAAGPVKLERVFAGVNLSYTMTMAQPPGDRSRWFVANRLGTIVSFPVANPPAAPPVVADVATLAGKPVFADLEGGFLGFAFHPKFAENGRMYVTFTTTSGSTFASEVGYLTSANGGASFTSYTKVLSFDRPIAEHNGGGIAFGNDGYLYLSFGEATDDTYGQMTTTFFGKVLRIDVDNPSGGKAYGIPPGNPFIGGGGDPEVFAYGLRNPFRLSIDRATNDVWVGDVGDDRWEEVDRIVAGGNYGWPCREGAHDLKPNDPYLCPSMVGLIDPIYEHPHIPVGPARSVTGGVVYRGSAMPALQGTYVYGDFMTLELFGLTVDPATGAVTSVRLNPDGPELAFTHFAEDVDGEIYATSVLENVIYKLVPAGPTAPSTFPERLSQTGCVDPADPKMPARGMIPYDVNVPLWSDGAEKERFFAIPDGTKITVTDDGDFDFPIGSVLTKSFSLGGKRIETRLFVRHDDGGWAGYTYEWNDEQTDATLLRSEKTKNASGVSWTFPSRSDCMRCHGAAAGRTLGPELAQLNGDMTYPSTGRTANQLATLEHIGMFSAPLGRPPSELPAYPAPFRDGPLEGRARAYLHSNCSMCHRPNGNSGRAGMDFRFATSLAGMKACNVDPVVDDLGVPGAKIIAPGTPERSIVSLRTHDAADKRMPPLGTRVVDTRGVDLLDAWIRGVSCP